MRLDFYFYFSSNLSICIAKPNRRTVGQHRLARFCIQFFVAAPSLSVPGQITWKLLNVKTVELDDISNVKSTFAGAAALGLGYALDSQVGWLIVCWYIPFFFELLVNQFNDHTIDTKVGTFYAALFRCFLRISCCIALHAVTFSSFQLDGEMPCRDAVQLMHCCGFFLS